MSTPWGLEESSSFTDRAAAYFDPKGSSSSLKKNAARFDIRNMQEQARKGSWRALLENIKEVRKVSVVFTPEEKMVYTAYHILALAKLGNYPAAAEELHTLGDFTAPAYTYDHHPDVYPGMSGCMLPFALRWLHAVVPYRLGQVSASMERMYGLLSYCDEKERSTAEARSGDAAADLLSSLHIDQTDGDVELERSAAVERWRRRRDIVIFGIINMHLGQKDYLVALRFLDRLLAMKPLDAELWSKFGYVQLQLGDVNGAKETFAKVEELVLKSDEPDQSLLCLVGRNQGLQAFVDKQYAAAVKAFNSVLEICPDDALAANNKALCLMYSRDLLRGTQVLEGMLDKYTVSALNETLILNLCSMYELSAVNSNESKRKMSSWILQVAPDDFDLTCTRL